MSKNDAMFGPFVGVLDPCEIIFRNARIALVRHRLCRFFFDDCCKFVENENRYSNYTLWESMIK